MNDYTMPETNPPLVVDGRSKLPVADRVQHAMDTAKLGWRADEAIDTAAVGWHQDAVRDVNGYDPCRPERFIAHKKFHQLFEDTHELR